MKVSRLGPQLVSRQRVSSVYSAVFPLKTRSNENSVVGVFVALFDEGEGIKK